MSTAGFPLPTTVAPVVRPAVTAGEVDAAGERRVNMVRLAALLIFYANHLLNVFLDPANPLVSGRPHTAATALALAWALSVVWIHLHLTPGLLPRWLSLAAIATDVLFVTLLLCLSRDPRSGMSGLYFLVILSAGVRLSLPGVYAATLVSVAGYALFQVYTTHVWTVAGISGISRSSQVFFALSLIAAGFLAGQIVRQARQRTRREGSRRFCPRCAELLEEPVQSVPDLGGRDQAAIGAGLLLLSGLMILALALPASNARLELDTLVGLGVGLALLLATGGGLQFCPSEALLGLTRGGRAGAVLAGLQIVLGAALVSAIAIAVTKTFF